MSLISKSHDNKASKSNSDTSSLSVSFHNIEGIYSSENLLAQISIFFLISLYFFSFASIICSNSDFSWILNVLSFPSRTIITFSLVQEVSKSSHFFNFFKDLKSSSNNSL